MMQPEQGTSKYKVDTEKKFQKSITMPMARGRDSFNLNVDANLDQLIEKNGW